MKMIVKKLYGPEDPGYHNERLELLFSAVKWAAELWKNPGKCRFPKWYQYQKYDEFYPSIKIKEKRVRYEVEGDFGVFIFSPEFFFYDGPWWTLIDGCYLCRVKMIGYPPAPREDGFRYLEDQKPVRELEFSAVLRADIEIWAPLSQDRVMVYRDGFYHPEFRDDDD